MHVDIHARHEKLPVGFTRRRKDGKCPYPDTAQVELMILTEEGIGSSGRTIPRVHDWTVPSTKVGGIVGYRLLPGITRPAPPPMALRPAPKQHK